MYYFFKSERKGKTDKLKLTFISGQKFAGADIDTSKSIGGCPSIVNSYPKGTIFVTSSVFTTKCGNYSVRYLYFFDPTKMPEEYKAFKNLTLGTKGSTITKDTIKADDNSSEKSLFETIALDKTLKCPTSYEDGFYMSSDSWNLLVRNIKRNINTMIIGPTGTGKTSCIKKVCERLGKKLYVFDMGCMIDPISSLLGVHRLESGKSIFDYAKFTQVIQEPCVILLDELNRASLACNNVLFPCLDDRRKLSIDVAGTKDVRDIKVHPDVTFIATANIGAEYSGTNSMDRALINRFFPLELGNLPQEEEVRVLVKRTGISTDQAKLVVRVANNIRSLANRQEISISLSVRETLMVSNLVADGWDLGKAMEMIYLPLYEGTKSEGERSTVFKTISSY